MTTLEAIMEFIINENIDNVEKEKPLKKRSTNDKYTDLFSYSYRVVVIDDDGYATTRKV